MNRRHATALIGISTAAVLGPSRAWSQDAGKANSSPLVGSWQLIALEDHRVPNPSFAFGRGSRGVIMYTPTGYMAVQIWRTPQPAFAAGYDKANLQQLKAVYEAFYAYNGKYDVDMSNRIVTHRIEASLRPEEIGKHYERAFEVSADRLTLTPMREGKRQPAHLTFQRVTPRGAE